MRGYLIVNSFMNTDKFYSLYEMLSNAFKKHNVTLEIKKASDISLEVGAFITNKPDFAIFWDKDIYLAERLEKSGVRLFNNKRAVMLCDNKILMYQTLKEHDIRIPRTFIAPKTFEGINYNNRSFLDNVIKEIGFPIIMK